MKGLVVNGLYNTIDSKNEEQISMYLVFRSLGDFK